MRWFRVYSEVVDDEKLRLLAFEDRWHYIALLACKSGGILDDGGALLRRKVAVKLGLAPHDFEAAMRRLAEVELIDYETLQPLAWDARQFQSDSSTDRVKQHRERHRNGDETLQKRPQKTDTEAETETEEKIESAQLPKSARATRLPPNFPGADEAAFCKTERPELDAPAVADKFRDYWVAVPGARGRKLDWPATWRNFVRSERGPPRPASGSARNRSVVMDAIFSKPREVIDVEPEPVTRRLG